MSRRPPEELINILACPACSARPQVQLSEDGRWVVCDQCHRRYPVRDGIPIMLVAEADQLLTRT